MKRLPLSLLTAAAVFLLLPVPAYVHEGATGIVKERMTMMKDMGKATKALAKMAKDDEAFMADRARALTRLIMEKAAADPERLFPEGSLDHPSEALSEIWEDWPTFTTQWTDMRTSSKQLATTVADNPDRLDRALRDLAATCRACHDDFRKD